MGDSDNDEPNNPAFEKVNDKLAELDQVLEHPDATGEPEEALAAMKQLAQELSVAMNNCSLQDFEEEYPPEDESGESESEDDEIDRLFN